MTKVRRITDQLEKPSLDKRSYRYVELPNKLEALLVHDAETDKSSASMNVNVGSYSDDDEMPGLAHAVEHALFMGTKKYPIENEYSSYLSANAGYSNAYTAPTQTNYFFECAAANEASKSEANGVGVAAKNDDAARGPFYGALDRFAQFFVAPLFLEATLDRELQAVDSENKKNLQSDQWRLGQLSKTLSNPKHPFSKFATGNLETLRDGPGKKGVIVRDKFIEFYDRHYSANRMKLVVLAKEPLDTLENWVAELFSDVPNKDLPQLSWFGPEQPLTQKELGTAILAKPVMESRTMELQFPFPDQEDLYKTQPGRYMSHLLGHEGPGSILSLLKDKGWANALSCGSYSLCPGTGFFDFELRLTPDGFAHYQEILKMIFQAIALVKEHPPLEWVFDEVKNVTEVNFRFRSESPAASFTRRTSADMQKPIPRDFLLSYSTLRKFDPEAITKSLEHLRPDNFRLLMVNQEHDIELTEKERWYGTQYAVQKIPAELLGELEQILKDGPKGRPTSLFLPAKNEFIPTRLDVERKEVAEPARAPRLIRNDDLVRLWWKKDDRFWMPKMNVMVMIRSPLASATPASMVKTRLFSDLLDDALSEYAYDAEIAGLGYNMSGSSISLDVNVGGYNDKLSVLLEKVFTTMVHLQIKPDRFKVIKERLTRGYKNWHYQQPYYQVGSYFNCLTQQGIYTSSELAAELPRLEVADVQAFIPQVLEQVHLEILAHGNLYKEEALRLAETIEKILKPRALPRSHWTVRRDVVIPPGSNYIYRRDLVDPANVNHTIEYSLLVGDSLDRTLKVKAQLFAQMLKEPTFDQLRTKEQLGYVVFSSWKIATANVYFRIMVQSERTPDYLETRIESHLSSFRQELEKMSDADFESHRRSVINSKEEKDKNLSAETSTLFGEISEEYYDFFLVQLDVAELKKLTKADILAFYNEFIDPASKTRAKLSVHMLAQGKAENGKGEGEKTEDGKVEVQESDQNGPVVQNGVNGHADKIQPVVIEDVVAWKAAQRLSAGPRAINDLSRFEELEAKL